jgi:hypothetical protein
VGFVVLSGVGYVNREMLIMTILILVEMDHATESYGKE